MRKSFKKRLKITRTGKLVRRKMGQGHNRAKKSGKQIRNKRKELSLGTSFVRIFKKYT